jgi:putative spermidine/putrescine transport system permease protein
MTRVQAGDTAGASPGGARWRDPRATPWLLVAPAVVIYVVLFVLPFGNLILSSFYDYSRLTGIVKTLTLKNYVRFWTDPFYLDILYRTFRVSLTATAVTLVVGFPVALYMTRASARMRALVTLFILSPLLVSVVVRSFGWLIILGPDGLLQSVLRPFGIKDATVMYTEVAVVVGLVNVFLPYMVLSIVASLQSIDPAVPRAAQSLGATRTQVFRRVTLPLSMPGVVAGTLIVFCLGSSAFVTPALLGGAEIKVLATLIYQQMMILQNWPFAAAISLALLVIVLAIVGLQVKLLERGRTGVIVH